MKLDSRQGETEVQPSDRRLTLPGVLLILTVAYVVAVLVTDWVWIGDAPDYATDVAAHFSRLDCNYLEFGHLLWRPIVYALVDRPGDARAATEPVAIAMRALALADSLALACGLLGLLSLASWIRNVLGSASAALFGGVVLIASKAFLNYAQVGSSYVPGFSFLCFGLFVASIDGRTVTRRVAIDAMAGVLYALSALLAGTFALALPGAVLSPLLWRRNRPGATLLSTLVRCAVAGTAGVLTLGVVYLLVARTLGITSLDEFRAWVSSAGHGITTGGVPRAVIGLARSFVDMGDYGRVVKRFMVKDPFNPVSVEGLVSVHLFQFVAFYVLIGYAILIAMRATVGRQAVGAALVIAVPLLVFAAFWQGGDLDRYLPAVPAILLVLAAAWVTSSARPVMRLPLLAGVAAMAFTNARLMNNATVRASQQRAWERVSGVPDSVVRHAIFIVPHWQDSLMVFVRNYPFHPRVSAGLTVYALLTPGTPTAPQWRALVADRVQESWRDHQPVFVSRRLLAGRPAKEWDWVEGDDPTVRWKDLSDFFATLELRAPAGETHEFVQLPESAVNVSRLDGFRIPGVSASATVPTDSSTVRRAAAHAAWPGWTKACHSGRS